MKVNELEGSRLGTYAKLVPNEQTKQRVAEIVDIINLPNPASVNDLHVTVVYSRKECSSIKDIEVVLPIVTYGESFKLFPTNNNTSHCLVLILGGNEIRELHQKCREEHGATHDFPTFEPHITLSYDYLSDQSPNESLLEYFKNLTFDKYEVEPLDIEWTGESK